MYLDEIGLCGDRSTYWMGLGDDVLSPVHRESEQFSLALWRQRLDIQSVDGPNPLPRYSRLRLVHTKKMESTGTESLGLPNFPTTNNRQRISV